MRPPIGGKCSWCLRRTSVSVFRSAGAVTIPCRQTQKDRRNVNTVFKCSWLFLSFYPPPPSSFLLLSFPHWLSLWVCVSGCACMGGWLSFFLWITSFSSKNLFFFFFSCKKSLYFYESMLGPVRSLSRLSVRIPFTLLPLMVLNLYSRRCTIFTVQPVTGWVHTSFPPLTATNLSDNKCFFTTGEMLRGLEWWRKSTEISVFAVTELSPHNQHISWWKRLGKMPKPWTFRVTGGRTGRPCCSWIHLFQKDVFLQRCPVGTATHTLFIHRGDIAVISVGPFFFIFLG